MKKNVIIFMVTLICACNHKMDSWKESGDEKEIAVFVRTEQKSTAVIPAGYQLFLFDAHNQLSVFTIPASEISKDNHFTLDIPEGRYTAYCIANCANPGIWEYTANSTPSQIFAPLQQAGEFWQEAGDYLLGKSEFSVGGKNTDPVLFNVERKVGCVRVIIENIPDWMNNLNIHLSAIPSKMNLLGKYSGEGVTVVKEAIVADENRRSVTNVLVYPPSRSSTLTLSFKAGIASETTGTYQLDSILANHITEVKAIFRSSESFREIDFSTEISEWDENVIRGDDWYIDLPGEPCLGTGNGVNLLQNGSFEEGDSDTIPTGWKLDGGGSDKIVSRVIYPVADGQKAIRLEGKTYLCQDVEVTAGQCYQLHLLVNAPTADIKWRYWGTWMAGSTNLNSESIRASSFRYQTAGYEDVYAGKVFKAPTGATKLRIEIRNYSDRSVTQEGLYVDAARVEKIE